jgi:GAF domain-containing protein
MERARSIIEQMSAMRASLDDVHTAVCQDIIDHVGSIRASIWYFEAAGINLTCACLIDKRAGDFQYGKDLTSAEVEPYMAAMRSGGCLNAPDAINHPATTCFRDTYLVPMQIASLLDFPIQVRGKTVAVLCCEHGPEVKNWTRANEEYLHQMAILLALSIMIGRLTTA